MTITDLTLKDSIEKQFKESQIRESIENNIDSFREKALSKGKVSGKDVANLFGFGDIYSEDEDIVSEAENDSNENENGSDEKDSPTFGVDDNKDDGNKEEEKEDNGNDEGKDDSNQNADDNKDDENKEKDEDDEEHLKPGETTTLKSFAEFFDRTNSKISITKLTTEPSPLFGSENTRDHSKYKVTLTNDKGGSVSWFYWDSENNSKANRIPDAEIVMKDFGKKLESAVVGTSYDAFKTEFGYDNVEETIANKQYQNLRKMKDAIKKIYPNEHNVYQLIQLSKMD